MRKLKAAEGDTVTRRARGCLRGKIELIPEGFEHYRGAWAGRLIMPQKVLLRSTRKALDKLQWLNGLISTQ